MRIQSSSTWWFLKVNLLKLEFLIRGLHPLLSDLHPLKMPICTPSKFLSITTAQHKIGGSTEPPIFFYYLAKSLEISRFHDINNGLVLP